MDVEDAIDVSSFSPPGVLPCIARIVQGDQEQQTSDFGALYLCKVLREAKVEATCSKDADEEADEERLVVPIKHPGWWQVYPPRSHGSVCLTEYKTLFEVVRAQRDYCMTCAPLPAFTLVRHLITGRVRYMRTTIDKYELLQVLGTCVEGKLSRKGSAMHSIFQCSSVLRQSRFLRRFLFGRCVDSRGQEVLIPLAAPGPFLKVGRNVGATEHDAVYQIRDLVADDIDGDLDIRLKPVTYHGKKKIQSLCLESAYVEDSVLACTLGDPMMMIEFPTDSEIKFCVLKGDIEHAGKMNKAEEFCRHSLKNYYNCIKVLQNVTDSDDGPRRNKVKPKRSFLMRNRDLPPLPIKVQMRRKSKWETLKYHKDKLLSQLQRSPAYKDPDYERIPFYNRLSNTFLADSTASIESPFIENEKVSEEPTEELSLQSSESEESPCVPRKSIGQFQSDDAGYLLPSEARQLVENYRQQISREPSCEDPVYSNGIFHRQSQEFDEHMDKIVFDDDFDDEGIDCEMMESFLKETMETIEEKTGSEKPAAEMWDCLETEAQVSEFLSAIFSTCEVDDNRKKQHDSLLEDSEYEIDLTEADTETNVASPNKTVYPGYRLSVHEVTYTEAETCF